MRIAVPQLRWPLDPARAATPDETTLVRTLLATPLRTDPRTGTLRPGLCSAWRPADGFRAWTFRCRHGRAIARQLRHAARLRGSPASWLFTGARVRVADPRTLVVRLRFAWRRFPYALTAAAAAPPGVPGPFRVVSTARDRLVAGRRGLRLVFVRLGPRAAALAFRRGRVDVAPVPLGDVRAAAADPALSGALRVRPLAAVDLVRFAPRVEPAVRRAYRDTADRGDYEALVPEFGAAAALGLVGGRKGDPAAFRRALRRIPGLPPVRVRIAAPADATLRYGLGILLGQWQQVGLGPEAVGPLARADARFERLAAPYAQPEALPAAAVLTAGPAAARAALVRALARENQKAPLRAADDVLGRTATVVPVAWVADARLVSPRLRGWRRDALGDVDYTRVTAPR